MPLFALASCSPKTPAKPRAFAFAPPLCSARSLFIYCIRRLAWPEDRRGLLELLASLSLHLLHLRISLAGVPLHNLSLSLPPSLAVFASLVRASPRAADLHPSPLPIRPPLLYIPPASVSSSDCACAKRQTTAKDSDIRTPFAITLRGPAIRNAHCAHVQPTASRTHLHNLPPSLVSALFTERANSDESHRREGASLLGSTFSSRPETGSGTARSPRLRFSRRHEPLKPARTHRFYPR